MESIVTTRHQHFQKRLVFYVIGMCFGSISFGYASAIIATTLGQTSFQEYMDLTAANPQTPHIEGALNSLFYAGGFFGAVFNSWFVDKFGRKSSIATGSATVLASCALCAGSVHVAMFIVFRFTTGWGVLMLLMSVPLWITEIAPPEGRGVLASIHGVAATCGYVLASYTGVGFYYLNGHGNQWRGPLALACLFPIITLCLLPLLPESPRYLLAKGREDEAWGIIQRLHRTRDDPDSLYARKEFVQLQKQYDLDSSLDSSWKILLTRPSYRRRVLIAGSVLPFLYSSGTLSISNYGPSLFAGLGYDTAQTLQFQAGIVVVGAISILGSMLIVDRVPRNVMLGGGMLAVAVPLIGETIVTARFQGTDNKGGLAAGVAFLYIYIFVYGIFLDGPGYFYANEIFPTHLRAKGATISIAAYSLINIMWTQVAPVAFASIGWKYYLVFVCCCVVGGPVMYFTYPDTLNKPLEEVAALFGDDDLVAIYQQEMQLEGSGLKGAHQSFEKAGDAIVATHSSDLS